jgi:protein-tyrosine phosphatase
MLPKQARDNKRILNIPGAVNLRDLGGYPTLDGRRVKWGRLYRSSHLGDLSARGLDKLSELNLHSVVDFRSSPEVERKPNRLPAGTRLIHLPIRDVVEAEIASKIQQRIKNNDFQDFDPKDYILQAYRQYATSFSPEYGEFLRVVLSAAGSPVLWNCAAGKDRTGFSSAILLRLLGVDQEIIFQDYLLSNRHGRRFLWELTSILLIRGWNVYQKIKPLAGVDRQWLVASFEMIDEEWGDFKTYTQNGLGLSSSEVQELRKMLLE